VGEADYSLYIVRCADGSLYTGIAIDVERRMREHESDVRGAKYLRGKGPLRLEFEQRVGNRSVASQIEYHVKQLGRPDKENLITGQFSLADLIPENSENGSQASGDACG